MRDKSRMLLLLRRTASRIVSVLITLTRLREESNRFAPESIMKKQSAFVANSLIRTLSPGTQDVGQLKCTRNATMALEIGQKVRVTKPLTMFHYPGRRNEPVNVEGLEGVVADDRSSLDGVPISATYEYIVKFADPKFKAHFTESELEVL